jgi:hypothetical protein
MAVIREKNQWPKKLEDWLQYEAARIRERVIHPGNIPPIRAGIHVELIADGSLEALPIFLALERGNSAFHSSRYVWFGGWVPTPAAAISVNGVGKLS